MQSTFNILYFIVFGMFFTKFNCFRIKLFYAKVHRFSSKLHLCIVLPQI